MHTHADTHTDVWTSMPKYENTNEHMRTQMNTKHRKMHIKKQHTLFIAIQIERKRGKRHTNMETDKQKKKVPFISHVIKISSQLK